MGSQGTTSARLDRLQCSLRQRPEQYVGATPLASLRATGLPQTGQLRTLAQANYVVAELPELADSWPACPRWSLGNFSTRCPPTGYRRRFAKRESRVANSGAPPIKKLLPRERKNFSAPRARPRAIPNRCGRRSRSRFPSCLDVSVGLLAVLKRRSPNPTRARERLA